MRRPIHISRYTQSLVALIVAACTAPASSSTYSSGNDMSSRQQQIARGRQVVLDHGCADCHSTAVPSPLDAGFLAGTTDTTQFVFGPFKTRARNITPDNATGIGRFSERQIFNAIRYGLRPGETPDVEITSTTPGQGNYPATPKYLAPPMPWIAFRHMSDADIWAIAAYLKNGLKPVSHRVKDSDGPPDFWASAYSVAKMGPYPAPAFPSVAEKGGN